MDQAKCTYCRRRDDCALKELAMLTMPWVEEALRCEGTEWDRAHAVRRALRGCGCSPGFVEDWLFDGAMTPNDVTVMVELIVRGGAVELAQLCGACRHYSGPELKFVEDWKEAANF